MSFAVNCKLIEQKLIKKAQAFMSKKLFNFSIKKFNIFSNFIYELRFSMNTNLKYYIIIKNVFKFKSNLKNSFGPNDYLYIFLRFIWYYIIQICNIYNLMYQYV